MQINTNQDGWDGNDCQEGWDGHITQEGYGYIKQSARME